MAVIAVTSVSFCRNDELRRRAEATLGTTGLGHDVRFVGAPDGHTTLAGPALLAALDGADAAIIGREAITDDLLAQRPQLRAIALYGVGYDNVDLAACQRHGVAFLHAAGVNAQAVAEHTAGLMLAALRQIAANDRLLKAGTWRKAGGHQLSGRTVAVVGCGHCGSAVARLLKAFGCPLLLVDVVPKPDLARATGGREISFADALPLADVITLHVPLTPATRHMINAETLSRMRPGSVLVNTSRGAVIDEQALRLALANGPLGHAALDVFESEPMLDQTLVGLANVVATPHTAGNAREAVLAMGQAALDKLAAYLTK
jgi:D-3-phosphoglycerate dehydrogenase